MNTIRTCFKNVFGQGQCPAFFFFLFSLGGLWSFGSRTAFPGCSAGIIVGILDFQTVVRNSNPANGRLQQVRWRAGPESRQPWDCCVATRIILPSSGGGVGRGATFSVCTRWPEERETGGPPNGPFGVWISLRRRWNWLPVKTMPFEWCARARPPDGMGRLEVLLVQWIQRVGFVGGVVVVGYRPFFFLTAKYFYWVFFPFSSRLGPGLHHRGHGWTLCWLKPRGCPAVTACGAFGTALRPQVVFFSLFLQLVGLLGPSTRFRGDPEAALRAEAPSPGRNYFDVFPAYKTFRPPFRQHPRIPWCRFLLLAPPPLRHLANPLQSDQSSGKRPGETYKNTKPPGRTGKSHIDHADLKHEILGRRYDFCMPGVSSPPKQPFLSAASGYCFPICCVDSSGASGCKTLSGRTQPPPGAASSFFSFLRCLCPLAGPPGHRLGVASFGSWGGLKPRHSPTAGKRLNPYNGGPNFRPSFPILLPGLAT